jgi:hypothetical protein
VPDAHQLIQRFHTAVDLWTAGVMLRRQTIRRARPEASARDVDLALSQWLQTRPGAEMGDGPPPEERTRP